MNVASMLWRTTRRAPEQTAVLMRDHAVTYLGLTARAGAIAHAIQGAGIEPGDRVTILLERSIDSVAAYFGVLAAGGVAVVINPLSRPRQIEYVLKQSSAKVLLTARDVLSRMHREVETDAVLIDLMEVSEGAEYDPVDRVEGDPAQITYTSGSTGMPKGVVASHGNVWCAVETVAGYLGLEENDRIAGLLPTSGVYGANQMQCAALVGGTLVIPTSPIMNQVAAELREAGTTVLAAVPPLWFQLLQAPGFSADPISSLRILQNAGGHLPPTVVKKLREVQPQAGIFLQYGMTEVFRSTFLGPEDVDARPNSMGRPMPGVELFVIGEDGLECGPGEVGELVHCGSTVTQGYWNDPERTERVFRPHPLAGDGRAVYSGDLVTRDAEGYFYFVGRRDQLIKTLGFRVGPDEILDALHASSQIVEGVVTSREDADRGQSIIAYVVLAESGSLQALQRFCRVELPRYMQPAEITVVRELPRLPNGKHDMGALMESLVTS